jgi:membrane protein YqaA with SNARE-associated domain
MELVESTSFLVADTLLAVLILPIHYAFVFSAMKLFGGYSAISILIFSSIGAMIAHSLNWGFGRLLIATIGHHWYQQHEVSIRRYQLVLLPLLLLCWVTMLGGWISVIAGCMRVRFVPFVFVVTMASISYYFTMLSL